MDNLRKELLLKPFRKFSNDYVPLLAKENSVMKNISVSFIRAMKEVSEKQGKPVAMSMSAIRALAEADRLISMQNIFCERIKERLKRCKREKLEVLFIPYKISMSDALQTVYLAAKEDPACDAYWCPIPYYECTADQENGEMHYEADGYGEEFEITDWQKYDVAKRHPDIIFTHNPYDDSNQIVRVHPEFYSSRLRELTDFLVLIDYGITQWVPRRIWENLSKEERRVPGYWNSDLVVTYSEEFSNVVRYHMRSVQRYYPQLPQEIAEEVITGKPVALGSPKFDLVLRARKEDYSVQEDWRKLIGNRKIILYNTALTENYQSVEHVVDDIEKTVRIFADNPDVVLWWRPHPLLMNSFQSMFPELLPRYERLVANYKKEGSGIYDDTPDLYRAITWSDGCLTNESSLVWLYLASGKPFTILNHKRRLQGKFAVDKGEDFTAPLQYRLANMRADKGANPHPDKWNWCIWWETFLSEDTLHRVHYDHFLERFAHFVAHREAYAEADEYRSLQLQIFRSFVKNSDGTAGVKIYEYCKQRFWGC